MKRHLIAPLAAFLLLASAGFSEPTFEGRKLVVLENDTASVSIDLGGGSICNFHLKDQNLNPLSWNLPEGKTTEPRSMGHFTCFDRWGEPSPAEKQCGMPFHGESIHVFWKVISEPGKKNGSVCTEMLCELPMGGMTLRRTACLNDRDAVLTVTETFTNTNKLGRVYNIVQHATMGIPFLDESVIVDTNARKGMTQRGSMPTPEEPPVYWPKTVFEGRLFDFKMLTDDIGPGVASFMFDDRVEYGWVTAANRKEGLLLGYVWETKEYPWLNMWYSVKDGKPFARGMEFGTTGLHKPFKTLIEKGTIFNRPIYEYLDAGESTAKTYTAFLVKIPKTYTGVRDIIVSSDTIMLKEYDGGTAGDIIINQR